MKQRESFVANSSSSSFIVVSLGNNEIHSHGDTDLEHCCTSRMNIDLLMEMLTEAKANGITEITFESGGGYDG